MHAPSAIPDLDSENEYLWSSTELAAAVTCCRSVENAEVLVWLTLWLRGELPAQQMSACQGRRCVVKARDGSPSEWTVIDYAPVPDEDQLCADGLAEDERSAIEEQLDEARELAARIRTEGLQPNPRH